MSAAVPVRMVFSASCKAHVSLRSWEAMPWLCCVTAAGRDHAGKETVMSELLPDPAEAGQGTRGSLGATTLRSAGQLISAAFLGHQTDHVLPVAIIPRPSQLGFSERPLNGAEGSSHFSSHLATV